MQGMKGNDEITGLFHDRLNHAEMTVREGFWEELQRDLPKSGTSANKQKRLVYSPRFYRITAAASVVLVLGAASAAFWYFSPKEEIKEAFTQVAALTPDASLNGDVVKETFPSIHEASPTTPKPGIKLPVSGGAPLAFVSDEDSEESMSVTLSITITQRVFGNHQQAGSDFFGNRNNPTNHSAYQSTSEGTHSHDTKSSIESGDTESKVMLPNSLNKKRNWALKASVGTSLPKGDYKMPLTAGVTVERSLNKHLSLEAGVMYSCLRADETLHTLAVPVKMNVLLANTSKVDLYATIGGAVEKCIAGALDNSFSAEPVQISVAAGLGVRYKLNERFALFAEPSVSHHFDTDSKTKTLRTERPTNMNLLCGVRMTY